MAKVNVPAIEVARAYLIAELSKIFSREKFQGELRKGINELPEKEIWRLLEALSFTYRLNGVFWSIGDSGLIWEKKKINCGKLMLTGMSPQIDRVTHSEVIQNNPLKFRDYLIKYFKKHPKDDPDGLGQFRPKDAPIKYPTIFLIRKEKKLYLLDGSNRMMACLLKGNEAMTAYVGKRVKAEKRKLGDSTFLLLRKIYETGDASLKRAVLLVTKELMVKSSDGRKAVKTYWVDHVRDKKLRKAGECLFLDAGKK